MISVECEPHVCADEREWRRYLGIAPTPGAARPADDATEEIEAKAREIAAQQNEIKHPDGAFAFLIAALYLFFEMFRLTPAIKLWYALCVPSLAAPCCPRCGPAAHASPRRVYRRHPARALAVGHAAIRILLRILLRADIAVDLVPEAAREGVRAALASGLAIFVAAGIFVRDDGAHRGSGVRMAPAHSPHPLAYRRKAPHRDRGGQRPARAAAPGGARKGQAAQRRERRAAHGARHLRGPLLLPRAEHHPGRVVRRRLQLRRALSLRASPPPPPSPSHERYSP